MKIYLFFTIVFVFFLFGSGFFDGFSILIPRDIASERVVVEHVGRFANLGPKHFATVSAFQLYHLEVRVEKAQEIALISCLIYRPALLVFCHYPVRLE